MDFVTRLHTTAFLGKEFLTWLWFKTDQQEGLMNIDDGGPAAEVWLTDRLVMSGAGQGADKVAIRAEDPTFSQEARTALRLGKKVEQARLRIVRSQREWTVSIKGEDLSLGAIKIPAVLTREEDEKLRERLSLLDQLDAMVTALFLGFLQLRMDPEKWPHELAQMQHWVKVGEPPEWQRRNEDEDEGEGAGEDADIEGDENVNEGESPSADAG